MPEYKNKVEAILFVTGMFMDIQDISQICEIGSVGLVKEALEELRKDYDNKESALTILEDNNKFKLAIKKEFNYLTTKLLSDSELDKATQETLAVIAYKQPVLQSKIIHIRGTPAYEQIKFLKENGFITREKHGRTMMIRLTPKFFDYFDIVEEHLKLKFDSSKINEEHKESLKEAKNLATEDSSKTESDEDSEKEVEEKSDTTNEDLNENTPEVEEKSEDIREDNEIIEEYTEGSETDQDKIKENDTQ